MSRKEAKSCIFEQDWYTGGWYRLILQPVHSKKWELAENSFQIVSADYK